MYVCMYVCIYIYIYIYVEKEIIIDMYVCDIYVFIKVCVCT